MTPIAMSDDLRAFIKESNRIEGIRRAPTKDELAAHVEFLNLPNLIVGDVERFVSMVAKKPLRDRLGYDVRVGNHIVPPGGPHIRNRLEALLSRVAERDTPWSVHCDYETLHPFLDGNGRSGRVLWLWQMLRQGQDPYVLKRGFLHTFYYQTLGSVRP